jgi:1-acyl-sn-glycerol-3-phosphate acyltransferase
MQWLRSLLFTIFLFIWTGLYAIFFCLAASLVPYRKRFAIVKGWGVVLLAVLKYTCGLRYQVEGREQLPPGNHVFLVKHSSSWETFAQVVLFPPQAWVLKRELTWIPFLGWGVRLLRGIAINRDAGHTAVKQVVEQARKRLAEGQCLVIFPEGTRMPPGQTRKYGISGALVAAEAGCMIIPVAHDAGYYWPRRGFNKRAGVIRVRIGPPIAAAGRDPRQVNVEAQAWIEANIVAGAAGLQR